MMASRINAVRCSHWRPSASRSASPAGIACNNPTRSADSTSCFEGVICIHRTRLPPLSTISALEKSLIHGGMETPTAGHSFEVRWA
jgi:hypothetical protein